MTDELPSGPPATPTLGAASRPQDIEPPASMTHGRGADGPPFDSDDDFDADLGREWDERDAQRDRDEMALDDYFRDREAEDG